MFKFFFSKRSSIFSKKSDLPVSVDDITIYFIFFLNWYFHSLVLIFLDLVIKNIFLRPGRSHRCALHQLWPPTTLFPTVFPTVLFPLLIFCPVTLSLFLSSSTKLPIWCTLSHCSGKQVHQETCFCPAEQNSQFHSLVWLQRSSKSEVNQSERGWQQIDTSDIPL